ncbi:MAG: GtrA family protein [Bacteroidia bacterium]|nr:GtrA family protein [Bacteroidia bacterium]
MKSLFVRLLNSSFVKYALVGVVGLVVDMGLFYVFYELLHINYIVSNIMSSSLAVLNNFILNSIFTFKVKDKLFYRFISFFSIALAGMALSSGMLVVMIDGMHWNSMVSKAVSVFFVALIQYYVNKKLTFSERNIFSLISHSFKKRR